MPTLRDHQIDFLESRQSPSIAKTFTSDSRYDDRNKLAMSNITVLDDGNRRKYATLLDKDGEINRYASGTFYKGTRRLEAMKQLFLVFKRMLVGMQRLDNVGLRYGVWLRSSDLWAKCMESLVADTRLPPPPEDVFQDGDTQAFDESLASAIRHMIHDLVRVPENALNAYRSLLERKENYSAVFIPSSGRTDNMAIKNHLLPKTQSFTSRRRGQNLVYIVVVKPREYEDYCLANPHLIVASLPTDRGSIGLSREWILQVAKHHGWSHCFMLDDSIGRLHKRNGKRYLSLDNKTALSTVCNHMHSLLDSRVALTSLPIAPDFHANDRGSKFTERFAASFVMLNVHALRRADLHYDVMLRSAEDIIMAHRCVYKGLYVLCLHEYKQHKSYKNREGGCEDARR